MNFALGNNRKAATIITQIGGNGSILMTLYRGQKKQNKVLLSHPKTTEKVSPVEGGVEGELRC